MVLLMSYATESEPSLEFTVDSNFSPTTSSDLSLENILPAILCDSDFSDLSSSELLTFERS